jgi:hypothetical protein
MDGWLQCICKINFCFWYQQFWTDNSWFSLDISSVIYYKLPSWYLGTVYGCIIKGPAIWLLLHECQMTFDTEDISLPRHLPLKTFQAKDVSIPRHFTLVKDISLQTLFTLKIFHTKDNSHPRHLSQKTFLLQDILHLRHFTPNTFHFKDFTPIQSHFTVWRCFTPKKSHTQYIYFTLKHNIYFTFDMWT